MEVKEITNKNFWEEFLLGVADKTFLQSWNWGEFQRNMENKIWRLGVYENNELIATVLVTKMSARRGKFLLIQHGPNINSKTESQKSKVLKVLLEELKRIGVEEEASFIRMNPLWHCNRENHNILKDIGFRESPMHANAYEATWKLDITLKSEEEILMNMRKTTRYLIRQAMKNPDITIERSERLNDVETYQKLNRLVAKRQRFVPFSFDYVKNEFEVLLKDHQILLLFGKYKGEVASAALVVFWSGTAFYHQAASDAKYAEFSIPYLLLWEAIKEAKKRSCALFDFWGYVDPKENPKHPWAGPTLFKMGFGGREYQYVKTQDFPLSKKYWLTFVFEKMRKIRRGL